MKIGKIITVMETNSGEWNQLWTMRKLQADTMENAIEEISGKRLYKWKTNNNEE